MSCGLGAIILVFMLVKEDVEYSRQETELLQAELEQLRRRQGELDGAIAVARADAAETVQKIEAVSREIARAQDDLKTQQDAVSSHQREKEKLEKNVEGIEVPTTPDVVEVPNAGEERYLMGLEVEGRRIGILIDASSSMTDEALIDIIRRKNTSDAGKRAGPKWQRTRRVAEWLLARVPPDSYVTVAAFADKATPLGGGSWVSGSDGNGIGRLIGEVDALVPEGPTNLDAGLAAMAAQRVSHLYLVTDGLPTAGDSGYRSLNPFSSCNALWGGSSKISGECRKRLFEHTVAKAHLADTVVNVILLPVEGDPEAADLFWRWTSRARGLLISPAASWP